MGDDSMSIHRRIEIRLWNDEKFRRLSPIHPSGQALWIYLLTGPHTGIIPGLFCAGHAQLAEALGWSVEAFREAFGEVLREGLAKDSPKDRLVWLPNAIKYNPPASPNVVRSWGAALDFLPECGLLHEAVLRLRDEVYLLDRKEAKGFAKAFREAFGEGFDEGFAKGNVNPSANQEQEQEQETGEKKNRARKDAMGDFGNVHLSPESLTKLHDRYGETSVARLISDLSCYKESTGKRYRDDYATLLNWAKRDGLKPVASTKPKACQHCGGDLDIGGLCHNAECPQYNDEGVA